LTLDDFLAEARQTIDLMETVWRKHHTEMPNTWPMQMAAGDWWEHLTTTDWQEVAGE
jgi:hypothetical protein